MNATRILKLVSILLTVALIGLAGWFFGNLYEAVVWAPNWRVGLQYEHMTGRSQFESSNPIWFYVPYAPVAVILVWVSTFVAWRPVADIRKTLGAASVLGLAAIALTAYVVTQLNLKLYFAHKTPSLTDAEPLVQQWRLLNNFRIGLVGLTLATAANGLRIVYRTAVKQDR